MIYQESMLNTTYYNNTCNTNYKQTKPIFCDNVLLVIHVHFRGCLPLNYN